MNKKRTFTVVILCIAFIIIINVIAYFTSNTYKNWVNDLFKFNVSSSEDLKIDDITMEITETYRVQNTIMMSVNFKNNVGTFPEQFNIGDFSMEIDGKDISLGTAGLSSNLSSNQQVLEVSFAFHLPEEYIGKELLFKAKNLELKTSGEADIKGVWTEKITIPNDEKSYTSHKLKESFVTEVNEIEYEFNEIIIAELPLIILNGDKIKDNSKNPTYISSQYGKKVKIEDSKGNKKEVLGTIDNDNNLIIRFENEEDTKDIEQIYIDSQPLL